MAEYMNVLEMNSDDVAAEPMGEDMQMLLSSIYLREEADMGGEEEDTHVDNGQDTESNQAGCPTTLPHNPFGQEESLEYTRRYEAAGNLGRVPPMGGLMAVRLSGFMPRSVGKKKNRLWENHQRLNPTYNY